MTDWLWATYCIVLAAAVIGLALFFWTVVVPNLMLEFLRQAVAEGILK
jgi:hypothetical protein